MDIRQHQPHHADDVDDDHDVGGGGDDGDGDDGGGGGDVDDNGQHCHDAPVLEVDVLQLLQTREALGCRCQSFRDQGSACENVV